MTDVHIHAAHSNAKRMSKGNHAAITTGLGAGWDGASETGSRGSSRQVSAPVSPASTTSLTLGFPASTTSLSLGFPASASAANPVSDQISPDTRDDTQGTRDDAQGTRDDAQGTHD